jgi:hypothetical protein
MSLVFSAMMTSGLVYICFRFANQTALAPVYFTTKKSARRKFLESDEMMINQFQGVAFF